MAALTANTIPKATAAATIENSLLTENGTTLTYSGSGGLSLSGNISTGVASGAAGTVVLTEGTAPSLTANSFSIYAPADVAAGGLAYVTPAAASTGFLLATNSSGVMTLSHVTNPLPVANGGTAASSAGITAFNNITGYTAAGATGTTSTNLVFSTSPTLTTPVLGVASATSINKVALTAPASGSTLTIADGKTLTASNSGTLAGGDAFVLAIAAGKTLTCSNSITLAGTDSTTMTFPPASASIGYLGMPQNSQSAAYTTVLADAGKHILHPTADNNARTFTIDSNANVAYPVGTTITFINQINTVTIAITTDTMTLFPAGTTGSRTLAASNVATAVKVASTAWVITGTSGLT